MTPPDFAMLSPTPTPRTTVRAEWKHPSAGAAVVYCCIAILLIIGFVFSPLLTAAVTHPDDQTYRREMSHPLIFGMQDVRAAFQRAHYPPATGGYYQPLTTLSIMLDNRLAGFSQHRVFQYHLTNIALHGLNVILFFLLLRRLSGTILLSASFALVFGLHPICVESIASVAHRMTLLGMFFTLLALLAYLRHIAVRHAGWMILVTICYSAAVLSKPTFAALPALLLVLDLWPLQRSTWKVVIEKLPLIGLAFVFTLIQFSLRAQAVPAQDVGIGGLQILTANVAGFVERLLWPAQLVALYPISGIASGVFLGDALIVSLLAAFWLASIRVSRPFFVVCGALIALIGPAILNLPFSETLLGDTYLYPAALGPLAVVAAWLGTRPSSPRSTRQSGRERSGSLGGEPRACLPWALGSTIGPARSEWRNDPGRGRPGSRLTPYACFAACCLAAILGVHAYAYGFVWQTSRDLYQHVVNRYPTWSPGYTKLVEACIAENELDAALLFAEQAVQLSPNDPSTQFYLGTTLLLHGDSRCTEAVVPLRAALASNTSWIECLQNLGVALARSGKLAESIVHLEKARDLAPDSVGIRIGLGNAYLQAHRAASARGEFQEALRLRSDPDIHLGLAVAWAANENPNMARRHLAAAVAGDARIAVKAARYPELLRLRGEPGFEQLIDLSMDAKRAGVTDHSDLETAPNAHGS